MIPSITRRDAIAGLAAIGVPLGCGLPAWAASDAIVFDVHRGGEHIGSHRVTFSHEGDELVVDVAIELEVVFAWVPVFRYSHRNREVWRDGRLQRLESRTNDDGARFLVTAVARSEGLVVDGAEGRLTLPPETLTTSYWHPGTVLQTALLDTQHGRLAEVVHRPAGQETAAVAGVDRPVQRYAVEGDLEMTLWYARDRQWCGLAFDARGQEVRYHSVAAMAQARWAAIAAMAV